MENPFAPQFGGQGEPHPRQVAFEDERVRLVLEKFELSACIPEMMRRFDEKWGRRWLTFEVFHEFFPTFPVVLEAHSFFRVAQNASPATLFRSFGETILLRRYMDVYSRGLDEAAGRPIGLVISFDGYRGGMILHNGDFPTRGTRMVHDMPGDLPPHRVTLEPFQGFLDYLGASGWTPRRPLAQGLSIQRRRVLHAYVVLPWMNRLLGCGPAKDMLAFLWTVLHTRSGYYRKFIHRLEAERYVAIDHDQLARQTGLSKDQVKRGIHDLRRKGLIATHRQVHKGQIVSHILLDKSSLRTALREHSRVR